MVLPVAEQELELLDRFLAGLALLDAPLDTDLDEAQSDARDFRARLTSPIRIAVAGLGRSGKTTLIHLLLGEELLTVDVRNYRLPPIEIRHGTVEQTRAGWWDRNDMTFDGLALSTALSQKPDVVSLILEHDLLLDCRLIDVSDFDAEATVSEGLFALTKLADMVIWCVSAGAGWTAQDRAIWDRVPRALQRRSMLALTHTEGMTEAEVLQAHQAVTTAVGSGFSTVLPVASTLAWQAVERTAEDPEAVWRDSGADDLFNAAMTLAADLRLAEIAKVARLIDTRIAPLVARVPSPPTPVKQAPTAAAPPVPASLQVPPIAAPDAPLAKAAPSLAKVAPTAVLWTQARNPALDIWLVALAQINADLQGEKFASDTDFVQACHQMVADFLSRLGGELTLPKGADWLIADFEQAQDLLVLMQYESGDATAQTAAYLLVQLTDALSWGATLEASVVAA